MDTIQTIMGVCLVLGLVGTGLAQLIMFVFINPGHVDPQLNTIVVALLGMLQAYRHFLDQLLGKRSNNETHENGDTKQL